MEEAIIILTNFPERDGAVQLARELIAQRLAACVNVLAACTSVYRWRGEVETAQEVPMLIKTRAALYQEVEAAIRKRHPYELPEIIAVPASCGLPDYLQWVTDETLIAI